MKQWSKWKLHLPYLHLRTLRVHNSMSDNLVDLRGNRAINAHALSLVERVLGHSLSDSGKKKNWLIILCCKPAKSANYASSAFLRKIKVKIILVMTNYAKNYANTIYQSLARIVWQKCKCTSSIVFRFSSIVHRLESFVWGLDVTKTENGEWETNTAKGKMKPGKKPNLNPSLISNFISKSLLFPFFISPFPVIVSRSRLPVSVTVIWGLAYVFWIRTKLHPAWATSRLVSSTLNWARIFKILLRV